MAVTAVFLSYFYPPLRAPRAIQVERLTRYSDFPIRVLCSAGGAKPPRPGVEVEVFPDRSTRWWHLAKHFLYLPDPQRPWAIRVAKQAVERDLIKKSDVLVTFGQPMSDHLAGLYLKQRIGMPWIAHFSDPWSDNPYLLPVPLTRPRLRRMEKKVFEAADRLLFTSEETLNLVMDKYPGIWRTKALVLPHAFDPALYGGGEKSVSSSPLKLRYLGNFYRQRNPIALTKAVASLFQTRPDLLENVSIELIGRWVGHSDWTPDSLGVPESVMSMKKPVEYQRSLQLMREADALLVIDAPFDNNVFFPSKLVDYMGAKRPILALTPAGTTANIVVKAGGIVASPESVETIQAGLVRLISAIKSGAFSSLNEEVVQQYTAASVVGSFDEILFGLRKQA